MDKGVHLVQLDSIAPLQDILPHKIGAIQRKRVVLF